MHLFCACLQRTLSNEVQKSIRKKEKKEKFHAFVVCMPWANARAWGIASSLCSAWNFSFFSLFFLLIFVLDLSCLCLCFFCFAYLQRKLLLEVLHRQIRLSLSFTTSYACIKRFLFVFRRSPRAFWFRGRKIGQLALYLIASFSCPNKII